MPKQKQVTLMGFCVFHSETGTEGGYWAFQDERFTGIRADHVKKCAQCRLYWDTKTQPNAPQPLDLRRFKKCDRPYLRDAAKRQRACRGRHKWVLAHPDGVWSREGLFVLQNGDRITIFDKEHPGIVAYSGTIDLLPYLPFTQEISGFWIRADQKGISRETWAELFFKEYPAEVTFGPVSMSDWRAWRKKEVEGKLKELGRL